MRVTLASGLLKESNGCVILPTVSEVGALTSTAIGTAQGNTAPVSRGGGQQPPRGDHIYARKAVTGLIKCFFGKCCDETEAGTPPSGYVFEMAACMSPCFVQLQWLLAVCSSESEPKRVDKVIKDNVVDLTVRMAERVGGEPVETPRCREDSGKGKSAEPSQKRKAGPFSTAGVSASSNAKRAR